MKTSIGKKIKLIVISIFIISVPFLVSAQSVKRVVIEELTGTW